MEVGRLVADIGRITETKYDCDKSGANLENAVKKISEKFQVTGEKINMYLPINYFSTFSKKGLIIAGGYDSQNGNHAWVIDGGFGSGGWAGGPRDNPMEYYVHCNMGLNLMGDGYYLIARRDAFTGEYKPIDGIEFTKGNYKNLIGWRIHKQ